MVEVTKVIIVPFTSLRVHLSFVLIILFFRIIIHKPRGARSDEIIQSRRSSYELYLLKKNSVAIRYEIVAYVTMKPRIYTKNAYLLSASRLVTNNMEPHHADTIKMQIEELYSCTINNSIFFSKSASLSNVMGEFRELYP